MNRLPLERCRYCDRYCDGCSLSKTKENPLDAARGLVFAFVLSLAAWGLFAGFLLAMHYAGLL